MPETRKAPAVFLLTLIPFSSVEAGERWQWALSPFYAPRSSASMKMQLVFSPQGALDGEGVLYRYDGRFSAWRDRSPFALHKYVLESEDNFYVGYSFKNGPWHARLFAGPSVASDDQFGFDVRVGAAAVAELLWLGPSGEFVGLEARGSTIRTNWSLSLVSGMPTGWNDLKLGPEAGVSGNVTGWNARLGVAATGMKLAGFDLGISAGALIDDQSIAGPYASLWLSGRF